ncbi:hypothetical protein F5880DRAFT_1679100 [Lentinula raphanica]|nr:hypothetical protein F5880DRAFT_1679100 [Lentinula raphanica]
MFAQNPQPTPTTIATASTPTAVTPVPPAPTAVAPISSIPGDSGHLPAPVSGISAVVPRAEAGSTASASQSQPTPPVSSYMSPLRMRSAVSSRSIGGVSLSTQPSSSPFQSITAIECANNTRLDHAAQVLGNSSSTRRKKRGLGRKAPQLHGVAESAKVEDFFSVADVAWLDIPGQPFAILVRSPQASRHQLLRFTSKGNINNNAKTPRLTPAKVESEDMTLRQIVTNTNDYGIAKFAITNSNVDRLFHPSQALLRIGCHPLRCVLDLHFLPMEVAIHSVFVFESTVMKCTDDCYVHGVLEVPARVLRKDTSYARVLTGNELRKRYPRLIRGGHTGYRNFNGDELDSGIDDEETNDDNNEEFGMLKAPAFTNSKKSKFDLGSKFGSGKLGFMDLGFSSDDLTASTTSNDASHASVPPPDAWNSSSKPVQKCLRLEFVFETCSKNSSHSSSPLAPPAPPAPAPPAPPAHVPGFSLPQGIVPDQVAPSKIGVFAIGTSGSVKRTTYGILGGSQKPEIVTKEGGGMIEQVSPKEIERSLKLFKPNDHRRLFILIPSAVGKTLLNSIHHPPNSTVWCLPRFHIHMLPINTPSSQPDHPPFLTNTLNFPLNQLILRALYAFRRARATSSADGGGFLYAFVDHGYRWKVGMSPDFERSRKEWDQQCPCEDRIRMNPIATTRRRRAESLAHLSLELECSERPKDYCRHCVLLPDESELDTGEGTAIPPGLESSSSMIIQKMVMLIIVLVDHSESDTSISEGSTTVSVVLFKRGIPSPREKLV